MVSTKVNVRLGQPNMEPVRFAQDNWVYRVLTTGCNIFTRLALPHTTLIVS